MRDSSLISKDVFGQFEFLERKFERHAGLPDGIFSNQKSKFG
jgi:hypothetical protein